MIWTDNLEMDLQRFRSRVQSHGGPLEALACEMCDVGDLGGGWGVQFCEYVRRVPEIERERWKQKELTGV